MPLRRSRRAAGLELALPEAATAPFPHVVGRTLTAFLTSFLSRLLMFHISGLPIRSVAAQRAGIRVVVQLPRCCHGIIVDMDRTIERVRAVLRLLSPDEITPLAVRMIEKVLDDEEQRGRE